MRGFWFHIFIVGGTAVFWLYNSWWTLLIGAAAYATIGFLVDFYIKNKPKNNGKKIDKIGAGLGAP